MPAVLWPLLFGNFVIGTGVMIVAGTLNEISGAFAISVPRAGQLISAGALLMCVTAPLLAALVAGWDRRRLLALSLVWYGVLHLACSAAPTFAALLPLRIAALPALAAGSIALNSSAMYAGQAIGAASGGWVIARTGSMDLLHWAGAAGMPAAIAASAWASRLQAAQRPAPATATG